MGALGLAAILLLAWGLSEDRRRIPWRTVIGGVALQLVLAVLLLGIPRARRGLFVLNDAAIALQKATDAGTAFVFGYLAGPPLPYAEAHPGASFILAFNALPLVLVISALAAVLFHWGVLQRVTAAFAWLLRRVLGIGGALAFGAAVHIFLGMIEAPLLVRPYLARMQRGELFALMTLRHGRGRGHGDGDLRLVPRPGGAERARQYPDRVGDLDAGGARHRRADGAVRRPRRRGGAASCSSDPPVEHDGRAW